MFTESVFSKVTQKKGKETFKWHRRVQKHDSLAAKWKNGGNTLLCNGLIPVCGLSLCKERCDYLVFTQQDVSVLKRNLPPNI